MNNNSISKDLITLARRAINCSYAPFSQFAVAAIIESSSGNFYTGCNIENPSYPATLCAEAVALGNMIVGGDKKIKSIWVFVRSDKIATPCGICRQRLIPFCDDDVMLSSATFDNHNNLSSEVVTYKFRELIPFAFNNDNLSP